SASGELHRYFSYSTCAPAAEIRRLAPLGDQFLHVVGAGLQLGDCGGAQLIASDAITAADGDVSVVSVVWYARANGDIIRCSASTTCASTRAVLATGQGAVTTIAHNDTRVFWIAPNGSEIRSRLKSAIGGQGDVDVIATGKHAQAMSVTSTDLYWTDIE